MSETANLVRKLYEVFLHRNPQPEEVGYWVERCPDYASVVELIEAFDQSEEHKKLGGVAPGHPPGHFYSPIHDPALIDPERLKRARLETKSVPGIDLKLMDQESLWAELVSQPARLARTQTPGRRYFHENQVYGPGDALVLTSMLAKFRPRKIIEIGSGFSSACMLDAADDYGLDTQFTFIEPYPDTLFWHLTESDRSACRIIQTPVQEVDIEIFDTLEAADLLFIDSTHVMKSGSDVNFEIFDILPRLRTGVIVHFHDMFWPFEYPVDWLVHRRYSWNELYGVRAFLMHNTRFSILFFNDAFSVLCPDAIAKAPQITRDLFVSNPGGGLWLRAG